MHSPEIREATSADFVAICALNLAEVEHTSPMDLARLGVLGGLACYHRVACVNGRVSAFLLAMRSGAAYDNANFNWFSARYADFIYIDRIVVSGTSRGLGLGTLLYEDLFRFAREREIPLLACEYNILPPNEPSRLFHGKFGFREQGRQWVAAGTKQVSMQVASVKEVSS